MNSDEEVERVFSQDECYEDVKKLLPFDSQEMISLMDCPDMSGLESSCVYMDGKVARHVSVPLSPPMTPASRIIESLVPEFGYQQKAGKYNFYLYFPEDKKPPSKSCHYTYSRQLNKLFVQKEVVIPLEFHTLINLPTDGIEIRSYLVFEEQKDRDKIVEQCPVHVKDFKETSHVNHVLRCVSPDATYQKCPVTNVYVCIFKHKSRTAVNSFKLDYTVSCQSTCRGGINRRSVAMLFALYVKNEFQGQARVSLQSCACPGRDRKNQELKYNESKASPSTSTTSYTSKKNVPIVTRSASNRLAIKKEDEPLSSASPLSPRSSLAKKRTLEHSEHENDAKRFSKCGKFMTQDWIEEDNKWHTITLSVFGRKNAEKVYDMARLLNDSQTLYRFQHGISGAPSLVKNGQIMGSTNERSERKKTVTQLSFEGLKQRTNVRSQPLLRSESDPTPLLASRARKMSLTARLDYLLG